MAEVALSWTGSDGFDDEFVLFPETMRIGGILGFDDADATFHSHGGGTVTLYIYLRKPTDASWVLVHEGPSTTGTISMSSLSMSWTSMQADAIRFVFSPGQASASHGWAGMVIRLDKVSTSAGAGGGGGGAGTGNMIGAFAVGSTMIGAEPGGGGGGGGSGTGNMIGGFVVGQTMLGAEPGGGGGDVPLAPGSPQPLEATFGGAATVAGAFATFIWEVAGNPAGLSAVSGYLNAPWPLAGTTADAGNDGITQYRTGWSFVSAPPAPGTRDQSVSYTITTTASHNATAYYYRKRDDAFVTSQGYSAGTSGQNFSWTFDAGADNYVGRIEINSNGRVLQWETFPEPTGIVRALLHSPIALFAAPAGEAAVAGDLSVHTLRGERADGAATATGALNLHQPIKPTVVAGNSSATGSLGLVVPMEATPTGDTAVTANLSQYISPATSNGGAQVTGNATHSVLSGQMSGGTEVVAGLATDASVQGGDAQGSSRVVGHARHQMLLPAEPSVGETTRLLADLTRLSYVRAAASGDSSVQGNAEITILDARGNGGSAGEASVVGHFVYAGGLRVQAAVQGEATVKGDYRLRLKFSAQTIVGTSTATCPALIRVWFVEGRPVGEATVAPLDMVIHTIPPGPIQGEATVVAHATHDARYGGPIVGEAVVKSPIVSVVLQPFPAGFVTANGEASVKGRLYVRPQDFDASTSDGVASLVAKIVLANLALGGKSVGGRHHKLTATGAFTSPPQYDDVLVRAYLASKAPFAPVTIKGFAAFDRAILLLNDSGLVTGQARLDAFLDFKTGVGEGAARGWSNNRGQFDFASDLKGVVTDAWAGVGKWFKDGFHRIYHRDYSLTMAPIKDIHPVTGEDHTGLPGNAIHHGASYYEYFGVHINNHPTVDSYINGHVWDGTYDEWIWGQHVRGLDWRLYPEVIDPETKAPYRLMPGPLRRKYQLLQPGERGTWMVDTRGPGFLDKAMRAGSVGEARFDEPQSTVDMDLELKSSMKGRIFCHADVTAVALLLSFRSLLQEGNVTALRLLTTALTGNAAKSPEALVPMTRENVDLLNPVRQSNAMYV